MIIFIGLHYRKANEHLSKGEFMKKYWIIAICVTAVTLITAVAMAQFAKTEDAIEYRKAMMFIIGNHFGQLGAVAKGEKTFDKDAVKKNAQLAAMMTQFSWDSFLMPQSDKGDTKMKSNALESPADFKAVVSTFMIEADKLAKVAETGDEAAFKAQFGTVAQNCKACHGMFRK